ncbi:MAG: hypothetical protein U9R20_00280 [Thermodesulfobacteriota bacterium]|nr:hypothetical protein [Thermodesulfobacteriota bacterium]
MSFLKPTRVKGNFISFNRVSPKAYIFCMLLCFLAIFFCPAATYAHGPGDVTLNYDSDSQILSVTISHSVSNPEKHYIKKITITKNGKPLETYEYKSQPAPSPFTYTYNVEAKEGDTLKVKVKCNYFGSKTKKLVIGK